MQEGRGSDNRREGEVTLDLGQCLPGAVCRREGDLLAGRIDFDLGPWSEPARGSMQDGRRSVSWRDLF